MRWTRYFTQRVNIAIVLAAATAVLGLIADYATTKYRYRQLLNERCSFQAAALYAHTRPKRELVLPHDPCKARDLLLLLAGDKYGSYAQRNHP